MTPRRRWSRPWRCRRAPSSRRPRRSRARRASCPRARRCRRAKRLRRAPPRPPPKRPRTQARARTASPARPKVRVRLFRRGESASTLDLLVAGLGNPQREYDRHRHNAGWHVLVAGLGNPGREYERTRHNAGWLVLDELARRHGGSWKSKFSGPHREVRLDDARLALLKPETYMNDSGRSVGAAARFYKVEPEQLLVVHDDVDLEHGRVQARRGGGLAGHNGLKSLAQHLGSQEFLRLRIGVGRPGRGAPRPVADWVLSPFSPEDDAEALVARGADAVEAVVADGLDEAQQRFN